MRNVSLFLILVSLLQSCNNETHQNNGNKSTEVQKTQLSETIVNKPLTNVKGKKNPMDYIPNGYVKYEGEGGVFTEAQGEIKRDLNNDGKDDIVYIIKGTDQSKIIQHENRGELDRNRRGIIVLLNKGDYYELATKNYNCFSSDNEDGGVYIAPELNVEINKGNLNINYSHGRYGYWSYTFRYQNGDLELIGYDLYSSRGPVPQYEVSINFLTEKKLTRNNLNKDDDVDYEVKYVDSWDIINVKKLIKLSEIKDFDGFHFDS